MHRLQELVRLHRLGVTERRAAKELRMGRNTARDYRRAIAAVGLLDGSADELPSLETLRGVVIAALPPQPAPQQVSTLETWQPHVEALLEKRLGPQAIHDRLRLGKLWDAAAGKPRKAWIFVMVLGHSRQKPELCGEDPRAPAEGEADFPRVQRAAISVIRCVNLTELLDPRKPANHRLPCTSRT
jgi:hypothetical protein